MQISPKIGRNRKSKNFLLFLWLCKQEKVIFKRIILLYLDVISVYFKRLICIQWYHYENLSNWPAIYKNKSPISIFGFKSKVVTKIQFNVLLNSQENTNSFSGLVNQSTQTANHLLRICYRVSFVGFKLVFKKI